MKDQALAIAESATDTQSGINFLREYLQHVILRELFELNLQRQLIFHGGTALRIIHNLNRFSEDLDFHTHSGREQLAYDKLFTRLLKRLKLHGYNVRIKVRLDQTVKLVLLYFHDLLNESGLSSQVAENLNIKIAIDTNPPAGFQTQQKLINIYFPFALEYHDQETFLAGKLHAILKRPFTKGRDFYDLMFYLSRWPENEPNFIYLNNALDQSGWQDQIINQDNWRAVVLNFMTDVNFKQIRQDLEPFIENTTDLKLIKLSTFQQLLKE